MIITFVRFKQYNNILRLNNMALSDLSIAEVKHDII